MPLICEGVPRADRLASAATAVGRGPDVGRTPLRKPTRARYRDRGPAEARAFGDLASVW